MYEEDCTLEQASDQESLADLEVIRVFSLAQQYASDTLRASFLAVLASRTPRVLTIIRATKF